MNFSWPAERATWPSTWPRWAPSLRWYPSVGRDAGGEILRNFLHKQHVSTAGICEDYDRPTTQKIRVMAEQQQIVRFDRESKHCISREVSTECMKNFNAAVKPPKASFCPTTAKACSATRTSKPLSPPAANAKFPCAWTRKLTISKIQKHYLHDTNTKEAWEGSGLAPKAGEEAIEHLGQKILKMPQC